MRFLVRGRWARVAQKVPRNFDSRPDRSRGTTGGPYHYNGHHSAAAATSVDPAAAPSGGQTGYATCPTALDDDDDDNDNDFKRSESATNAPSPTDDSKITDSHRQTYPSAASDLCVQPCCGPNPAIVKTASFATGTTSLVRTFNRFVHLWQHNFVFHVGTT